MKYKLLINASEHNSESIIIDNNDGSFTSFPAVVGNPNYDAFLVQVDLTDEEVKALPTDEWFEV